MRLSVAVLCISTVLLCGCATPSDGYYDANGNYVPYNRYNREAHDHSPLPGGTHDPRDDYPVYATTTTYTYDRPGYYDRNGYYTAMNGGLTAPESMLPPRGMCRVWYPDRTPSDQPPVESCTSAQLRAPGTYVIYGG